MARCLRLIRQIECNLDREAREVSCRVAGERSAIVGECEIAIRKLAAVTKQMAKTPAYDRTDLCRECFDTRRVPIRSGVGDLNRCTASTRCQGECTTHEATASESARVRWIRTCATPCRSPTRTIEALRARSQSPRFQRNRPSGSQPASARQAAASSGRWRGWSQARRSTRAGRLDALSTTSRIARWCSSRAASASRRSAPSSGIWRLVEYARRSRCCIPTARRTFRSHVLR